MISDTALWPLRQALDAKDGFSVARHRQRTARVAQRFAHSVAYWGLPPGDTCVTFTFNLRSSSTYVGIADDPRWNIFAGGKFMDWALATQLVELDGPRTGCLACYFDDQLWTHIGIMRESGRILSKWGTFPVYDHEAFEVPISYGKRLRFFEPVKFDDCLDLFIRFAKLCGMTDADIRAVRGGAKRRAQASARVLAAREACKSSM